MRTARVDAEYSPMLFNMALTTPGSMRFRLRSAAFSTRAGGTPHRSPHPVCALRRGIARGDDRYENGGFLMHLFDRALVDRLASGYALLASRSSKKEGSRAGPLWSHKPARCPTGTHRKRAIPKPAGQSQ